MTLYYEQGTGNYGEASKLIFFEAPDADAEAYENDDAMWEYMNLNDTRGTAVDLEIVADILRNARDRKGDYLAGIEHALSILDPGDSVDFEDENE